jgi:hypothetical protein
MNQPSKTSAISLNQPPSTLELMSGKIELVIAQKDIEAILNHEKLGSIIELSIGGSMPKEDFFSSKLTDTNSGVMMWYCYNGENSLTPEPRLFLAAETMYLDEINNKALGNQKLTTPTAIFSYDGNKNSQGVNAYLREASLQPFMYAFPMGIKEMSAADLNQSFAEMQKDAQGENFNTRTWAYFQNNKEDEHDSEGLLTQLVNQENAVYIHYYFGYDETAFGKNRIRVILIAADKDHQNIMNVIVQRSTPPA